MNLYLYIEMRRVDERDELEPTESDFSYTSGRHVWVEAEDEPRAYRAGQATCAASPVADHSRGRLLGDYLVQMTDSVTPENREVDD